MKKHLFLTLVLAFSLSQAPHEKTRPLPHNSDLPETGRASKLRPAPQSPSEIKVVSYNIRWRGGDELRKIAQLLKDDAEIGGAAILGLQEVDRNKKRTGNKNTAKALAEELGMYYAWTEAPPPKSEAEEGTGVLVLSSYPLTHVHRIVLPHPGPGGKRRVVIGATVTIGSTTIRVYSVHSETRLSVGKKIDQMKAVIADLAHYRKDMPAIVLGDLNTWERDAVTQTSKLFEAENFHTPFDKQPTFFRRVLFLSIDLKLDWIWLRNLQETTFGIDREHELSDHWPLWVVLRLGQEQPLQHIPVQRHKSSDN